MDCASRFSDFPVISGSDNILVQNFLGKQLNGQNGPDVKATIVQYSYRKSGKNGMSFIVGKK